MSVVTYKCKNCGGELLFDPDTQQFHCEYCDSYFTESELQQDAQPEPEAKNEEQKAAPKDDFYENVVEYTCPNCGAQVIAEASTAATWCYYCHNPVVLSQRLSNNLKPDKVIPFVLDKEKAAKAFEDWKKTKWFLKPGFSQEARLEKMAGVYYPYWKIDSTTHGFLRARGEKVRTWRKGNTEYIETSTYGVTREGSVDLDNLTFTAIKREDIDLTQGVYPFDFSKAVNFSMAYLSGFLAERRMTDKVDIRPEAERKIDQYTQECLRSTVRGYDHVYVEEYHASTEREKWQYMLLPAWVMTYQYHGETYYYAVNGQTGKVCGRLPLSKARLAILFGGVTAAVAAVAGLIGGIFL